MTLERLLVILEDWKIWMKSDNHRLGYPSHSLGISTGGESSNVFEDMVDQSDNKNVQTINAIINSLPKEQRESVYHVWLQSKAPKYWEFKYDLALDNLLTLASKRIFA